MSRTLEYKIKQMRINKEVEYEKYVVNYINKYSKDILSDINKNPQEPLNIWKNKTSFYSITETGKLTRYTGENNYDWFWIFRHKECDDIEVICKIWYINLKEHLKKLENNGIIDNVSNFVIQIKIIPWFVGLSHGIILLNNNECLESSKYQVPLRQSQTLNKSCMIVVKLIYIT